MIELRISSSLSLDFGWKENMKPLVFHFLFFLFAIGCSLILESDQLMNILNILELDSHNFVVFYKTPQESILRKLSLQYSKTLGIDYSNSRNISENALKTLAQEGGLWLDNDGLDQIQKIVGSFVTDNAKMATKHPLLVLVNSQEAVIEGFSQIQLDQFVYFLDLDQMSLTEKYAIVNPTNGVEKSIVVELGRIHPVSRKFQWNHDVEQDPFCRRRNFHQIQLRVMIEVQAPFNMVSSPSNPVESDLVPESYEVTGLVSGLFRDVMKILEHEHNFTTRLFKRFDGQWGNIDQSGNWNGMLRMLLKNQADIAGSSLLITLQRSTIAYFLTPVGSQTISLVIQAPNLEATSWITYVIPMTAEAWITLIWAGFGMALIIFVLKTNVLRQSSNEWSLQVC